MYFSEKMCNDCSIAGKLQSWFGSVTWDPRKSQVFIVIKDILGFWYVFIEHKGWRRKWEVTWNVYGLLSQNTSMWNNW
jgi:hypothetical protein